MLSKCANPACFERFMYLSHGRIFNIEVGEIEFSKRELNGRRIEHFWLCERCAETMKVVYENGVVTTRPLYPQLPASNAKKTERNRRIA